MSSATLFPLIGACLIFLTAASAMRGYVGQGALWMLLASLALYVFGNLLMIRIMREGGMALAISITSVVQLILATLVAVFIFAERPTGLQWGGIALGVLAVAMILWPSGRAT
ncbi:hypothetical protein Q9295_10335 [Xinfangfangia sp. CPCC 101601]|uniref:EamA domain-containing protein n=1 Tax=Pseudogemmobacter lacusdianii TaxID=3069608 RepID=A0ABU0W003_9RHOB|nr:hypothetical protein [Xinfangfangia sp. CPCC 101601]MDQ2066775.1 hypothetical protein [Xinfangfangia sp. CPCC 101601]